MDAPVGCFCSILAAPSACLTCTCPDCGAAGRFGAPIAHGWPCRCPDCGAPVAERYVDGNVVFTCTGCHREHAERRCYLCGQRVHPLAQTDVCDNHDAR